MKFLHTADWHLGRQFHNVSLIEDQAHVLDQFVALAREREVDAVVIAGSAPTEVLLGMSFMNRVSWREDQGMLLLESKY